MNEKGKYPVSNIKNIHCRNFGTVLGRNDITYSRGPSPVTYDISNASLSPDGKYPLSKMENTLTCRFRSSDRSSLEFKKNTPGPGNYKLPSDFGHYVPKKFKNSLQTSGKENK